MFYLLFDSTENMLFFGILFIFLATTSAEYCTDEVNKFCSTTKKHEIGV